MGEVVVSEGEGNIVFNKEGRRLRSVQHILGWCSGIAVDGDNDFYCTDFSSNKILNATGFIILLELKSVQ